MAIARLRDTVGSELCLTEERMGPDVQELSDQHSERTRALESHTNFLMAEVAATKNSQRAKRTPTSRAI